jgi:phytoene dehydrogenase-like protein
MELADGRVVQTRRGVANVNPRMLYLQMLDAGDVAPEIRARMQRYRAGSARFRMNVALSELPHFDGSGPAGNDIHGSGILIAPSLAYMDSAFIDARSTGMSQAPVIEILLPSRTSSSIRSRGMHRTSARASSASLHGGPSTSNSASASPMATSSMAPSDSTGCGARDHCLATVITVRAYQGFICAAPVHTRVVA